MNKNYLHTTFLFLVFSLLSGLAFSQKVTSDTLFVSKAQVKARKTYTEGIASEAHLFNGVQYRELNLHNYDQGNPYFISDDWIEGSIFYDGQLYENVSILYDIIHDKVVIDHTYSHFSIELINEKVKSFSIANHKFVRLVKDSLHESSIHTGFYDVLYDGKVKVYVKRKKEIHEVMDSRIIIMVFDEKDQFFIYKNGNYFQVKNKSSILKVLSDRKSSLRKFINKSKLNFHTNRDLAIAESVRFYDESEKQP